MAQHWANADYIGVHGTAVGLLKPYQMLAIMDMLSRISHVEDPDYKNGSDEATLDTIIGSLSP